MCKLIFIQEALQNNPMIDFRCFHPTKLSSSIMSTSSTYRRCVIYRDLVTFIPKNKTWSLAFKINLLIPFISKMNIYGDIGHPCVMPLVHLNYLVGNPLIKIEKLVEVMHDMIELVKSIVSRVWRRISLMKDQSNRSYDFSTGTSVSEPLT